MPHPTLRLFDGTEDTSPELNGDVQVLQSALIKFGFNVQVDGIFGSETEGAVRQFQLDHDLYVDGVVGPATWAALANTTALDPATTLPTTISATNQMMTAQLNEAAKFRQFIDDAGTTSAISSALIAGIGSRESGWGLLLRPTGPGGTGDFAARRFPTAFRASALPPDGGFGRGLMQIDFDAFEFARTGNWKDPQANIDFGCKVLKGNVDLLARKTSLQGSALFRAAIAAYNSGAGNVLQAIRDGRDIDFYTTGRNYSADVLNRAGFFQAAGWSHS